MPNIILKFEKTILNIIILFSICILFSCEKIKKNEYPAGDNFDFINSDKKAIEIADKVVETLGGYKKFEKIRYYIIYGVSAILYWDKYRNLVRLRNYPDSKYKDYYIYDAKNNTAVIKVGDRYIKNRDSMRIYTNTVRNIFEIESYHLLLPFKLKDSGVTLKYLGEVKKLPNGNPGEKLQLTFKNVGRLPNSKIHVYVDKTDYRINKYEFFRHYNDENPVNTSRMDMYRKNKGVYFSYNRTDRSGARNVIFPDSIPAIIFNDIEIKIDDYFKEK